MNRTRLAAHVAVILLVHHRFAVDHRDPNRLARAGTNPDIHQKTLGRIFKISHQKDRWWTRVNLGSLSSDQLVGLQVHRNDWYVRHARRILQERDLPLRAAGASRVQQTSQPRSVLVYAPSIVSVWSNGV